MQRAHEEAEVEGHSAQEQVFGGLFGPAQVSSAPAAGFADVGEGAFDQLAAAA